MGFIDLHIHSCCSDGVLTPFEIVDQAMENHVDMISITDHDCIDAYTLSFLEYARKMIFQLFMEWKYRHIIKEQDFMC